MQLDRCGTMARLDGAQLCAHLFCHAVQHLDCHRCVGNMQSQSCFRSAFNRVPLQIGNSMFTFAWNYMDVFIMMISLGLAERFKQINQRLASYGGKPLDAMSPLTTMRPDVWLEIRQHYVLLCELLETVDVNLAPIILLSSANNLYFICFQLLNIFK